MKKQLIVALSFLLLVSTVSGNIIIEDIKVSENHTDLNTGLPSPEESKIKAHVTGFNLSSDTGWVEFYNTNKSELAVNHTLAYDSTLEGDYNFTNPIYTSIRDVNTLYNYTVHIKDSSSSNNVVTGYKTFYHDNSVYPKFEYEHNFNGSTLTMDGSHENTIKWYNWHGYTNAYNLTYDLDVREAGSGNSWNDLIEATHSNYDGTKYATSGHIDVLIDNERDVGNFIDNEVNVTYRHTQRYYNATTGKELKSYTEYTIHPTSNTDRTLYNAFIEAINDSPIGGLIGDLWDIGVEMSEFVVSWVINAVNFIIDIITGLLVALANIISYLISIVTTWLEYQLTLFMNYYTEVALINMATNDTINLSDSNQTLTVALDDGFTLKATETINDNVTEANTTLDSVYGNMDRRTIYSFDYRSGNINETITEVYNNNNLTTDNFTTNDVNNFNYFEDCTDSFSSAYSTSCVHYKTTSSTSSNPYAWIKYDYSLDIPVESTRWLNTTQHQQFIVESGIDDTYDVEPFGMFLFNGSTSQQSITRTVYSTNGDKTWDWRGTANYRFNRVNNTHINVTIYLDGQDVSADEGYGKYVDQEYNKLFRADNSFNIAFGTNDNHNDWEYTNTHAVYNITTDLNVEGVNQQPKSTFNVYRYVNPYEYPSGYPIGTLALFGIVSTIIAFFTGLLPDSVINATSSIIENVGAIVNGTISNIDYFMELFTEIYVKGAEYIPQLVTALGLWKGYNWAVIISDAMDESKALTLSEASNQIIADVKDNMLMIQEVAYRSIEIMTRIVQVFMYMLQTIKAMLWWR